MFREKKKWIIGIGAVLFLAILVAGIFLNPWTTQKDTDSDENTLHAENRPNIENISNEIPDSDIYVSDDGLTRIKPVLKSDTTYNEKTHTAFANKLLKISVKEGTKRTDVENLAKQYNAVIVSWVLFSSGSGTYTIEFENKKTLEELNVLIEGISALNLDFVNKVRIVFVLEITPDISYRNDDWNGATWDEAHPWGNNWGVEAIRMPSVWDELTLKNPVKVGVCDSVFGVNNDDLKNIIRQVWNQQISDWSEVNISLRDHHGTAVSSIIGAEHGNGIGISGVVPNAELYCFAYKYKSDEYITLSDYLTAAIKNMLGENARTINFSVGLQGCNVAASSSEDAVNELNEINDELTEFLWNCIKDNKDFLIVKSAGNTLNWQWQEGEKGLEHVNENGFHIRTDAKYDIFSGIEDVEIKNRIIVVGSASNSSWSDTIMNPSYHFSSDNNGGDRVNILAPGEDILCATLSSEYVKMTGTSVAAPHVTGVAALVWATNPELTGAEVKQIIIDSAIIPVDGTPIKMIDAYEAVKLAKLSKEDVPDINPDRVQFGGNTYQCFDISMTWHEAKAYCENLGGHLATITSQSEQDFIAQLIRDKTKDFYWLGATDELVEGTWEWVTGEKWEYTNWSLTNPNNNGGVEHYLGILRFSPEWGAKAFEWNDFYNGDSGISGFVCEWETASNPQNDSEIVYINTLKPVNSDKYTGNMGDSYIGIYTRYQYSKDSDIRILSPNSLIAWVARWNGAAESSWVWNEYNIEKQYNYLLGEIVLVNSQNMTDFNTKFEVIGDGRTLFSADITPKNLPLAEFNINVQNIANLTIKLTDNRSVAGGTAFGLVKFRLVKDNVERTVPSETPKPPQTNTLSGRYYLIVQNDPHDEEMRRILEDTYYQFYDDGTWKSFQYNSSNRGTYYLDGQTIMVTSRNEATIKDAPFAIVSSDYKTLTFLDTDGNAVIDNEGNLVLAQLRTE